MRGHNDYYKSNNYYREPTNSTVYYETTTTYPSYTRTYISPSPKRVLRENQNKDDRTTNLRTSPLKKSNSANLLQPYRGFSSERRISLNKVQ